MNYDRLPWLHFYPQLDSHAEVYITGTKEGLTALRQAIDQALKGEVGETELFTADGEGYAALIKTISKSTLDKAKLPYVGSGTSLGEGAPAWTLFSPKRKN